MPQDRVLGIVRLKGDEGLGRSSPLLEPGLLQVVDLVFNLCHFLEVVGRNLKATVPKEVKQLRLFVGKHDVRNLIVLRGAVVVFQLFSLGYSVKVRLHIKYDLSLESKGRSKISELRPLHGCPVIIGLLFDLHLDSVVSGSHSSNVELQHLDLA